MGMAIRLFGLLMALVSARIYSGCKQFPKRSDNRLGEIAQVQLIFNFLYALLLKLETDEHNSTEWDNYIFDILMVLVNFSGFAIALLRPTLEQLLGRTDGQVDDVEAIAEEHGYSDDSVKSFLHETFAAARQGVDDDVESGHVDCCR